MEFREFVKLYEEPKEKIDRTTFFDILRIVYHEINGEEITKEEATKILAGHKAVSTAASLDTQVQQLERRA